MMDMILFNKAMVRLLSSLYRRRPRRPPFLLVLSVGIGVTSSILPIRIPALASALSADCAPGPGVFEPFPITHHQLCPGQ